MAAQIFACKVNGVLNWGAGMAVSIDALPGYEFPLGFVDHCRSASWRACGKPINVYESFDS